MSGERCAFVIANPRTFRNNKGLPYLRGYPQENPSGKQQERM
jgi:hypothetical protein